MKNQENNKTIGIDRAAHGEDASVIPSSPGESSPSPQLHKEVIDSRLMQVRRNFRRWRKQRPFWGALLMMVAGLLVLWSPASLLSLTSMTGGAINEGLFVGSLLFLMGLLQLLAPSHALITGAIGIVLSLASVLVALGGMGIGVFLGLIGSSIGVAWQAPKPLPPALSEKQNA